MTRATFNGKVIAESDACVIVEGNSYFPPNAIKPEYLSDSHHTSICSWKGTAKYKNVKVDGKTADNSCWYYQDPKPEAVKIKGHYAFWKGVVVE